MILKFYLFSIFYTELSTHSCGIRQLTNGRQGRVVNGNYTFFGEFPWQAVIFNRKYNEFDCGGVLLNKQWILTSAHCIKG